MEVTNGIIINMLRKHFNFSVSVYGRIYARLNRVEVTYATPIMSSYNMGINRRTEQLQRLAPPRHARCM